MEVYAKINNVPEYAQNKSGFMVAKVVSTELWFYGIYEAEQEAQDIAEIIGDAIVLERKV